MTSPSKLDFSKLLKHSEVVRTSSGDDDARFELVAPGGRILPEWWCEGIRDVRVIAAGSWEACRAAARLLR